MMKVIDWFFLEEDEPDFDLYGEFGDIKVDIVRHVNGTWSILFNTKNRVKSGISSRVKARYLAYLYLAGSR